MTETLLVDSSVVISALLITDSHHSVSRRFFDVLEKGASDLIIIEPATVIIEIENVLVRLNRSREAAELYERFLSVEVVPIDREFVSGALPLLPKMRLKTADAIVAISAYLWEAVLISWDKELVRQAGRIVSAYTPNAYLKESKGE